jgi:hypothetical protein
MVVKLKFVRSFLQHREFKKYILVYSTVRYGCHRRRGHSDNGVSSRDGILSGGWGSTGQCGQRCGGPGRDEQRSASHVRPGHLLDGPMPGWLSVRGVYPTLPTQRIRLIEVVLLGNHSPDSEPTVPHTNGHTGPSLETQFTEAHGGGAKSFFGGLLQCGVCGGGGGALVHVWCTVQASVTQECAE